MYNLKMPGYIVGAINRAQTVDELQAIASRHLDDLGFSMFAFHMVRHTQTRSADKVLTILTDYPKEWLQRYTTNRYIWQDLVHERSAGTIIPFAWSEAQEREIPKTAAIVFEEAAEFGLRDGFSVPVRGLNNTFSVFSAVADGTVAERRQALKMNGGNVTLLASLLHQRCTELLDANGKLDSERVRLTDREREVLKWIGSGKTSPDIADILGISEATVDSHVHAAMVKLDATTRTHAAVVAAMEGLIDPV